MLLEKNYYTPYNRLRIGLRTLLCWINSASCHIMESMAECVHFKRCIPRYRGISLDKRTWPWLRCQVETDALCPDGSCHFSFGDFRSCVQSKSPLCSRKCFVAVSILQESVEGKSSKRIGKMPLLQPHGPADSSENQKINRTCMEYTYQ